jgi:hypothetical protein
MTAWIQQHYPAAFPIARIAAVSGSLPNLQDLPHSSHLDHH